jgi:alkylation response protein AidB-like acyl-CoA dehydrogenase
VFLALDTHEQEFADAAAGFLRKEFPLERLHREAPETTKVLRTFSAQGWLGLSAPASIGGSELGVIEEMLFFLQLGRVSGPVEVLAQILAVAVARDDHEIAKDLIAGNSSVALLVERSDAGDIRFIGPAESRYALCVTAEDASLFGLHGSACTAVPCLDRSVQMYTGRAAALTPSVHVTGAEYWCRALVGVSAMLIGAAECALDMIVEYAKLRETFGRAIGAYQAVRHPCADMAIRVEAARCQLFYAATALKENQPDALMQIDAARLLAQKAATANTDANIQLHGGIGVTDEHNAHLLLKRANLLWRLFGSSRLSMQSLLADSGNAGEGNTSAIHSSTAVEGD